MLHILFTTLLICRISKISNKIRRVPQISNKFRAPQHIIESGGVRNHAATAERGGRRNRHDVTQAQHPRQSSVRLRGGQR